MFTDAIITISSGVKILKISGGMQVKVTDFKKKDMLKAQALVRENYEEERNANPQLPKVKSMPGLEGFADNGLGVALYEEDEMLGFLCTEVSERFGNPRAFCPIHAHGAVMKDRGRIYSRLYGAAAQKWVDAKALTHEVTLFSHDTDALDSFFYNVFGACVMYAVMDISSRKFDAIEIDGIEFRELEEQRYPEVRELHNGLFSHLRRSPVFLPYYEETPQTFARIKGKRYFVALKDDEIIAYIRLQQDAGNFVATQSDTVNISGAFMKPQFRGSGIYSGLLECLASSVKKEGYDRISVDYETYNPNAMRFWAKNFVPYTTTLTRKIEPKILETPDF